MAGHFYSELQLTVTFSTTGGVTTPREQESPISTTWSIDDDYDSLPHSIWSAYRQRAARWQYQYTLRVAKWVAYTVLRPPAALRVAKVVQYVVVIDYPIQGGPPELLKRFVRSYANGVNSLDDDYTPWHDPRPGWASTLMSVLGGHFTPPDKWPLNIPDPAYLANWRRRQEDENSPVNLQQFNLRNLQQLLLAQFTPPTTAYIQPHPFDIIAWRNRQEDEGSVLSGKIRRAPYGARIVRRAARSIMVQVG